MPRRASGLSSAEDSTAKDGAQYGAQVSGKIIENGRLSGLTCGNESGAEGTRTPDPLHAICHQRQLSRPPTSRNRCYF